MRRVVFEPLLEPLAFGDVLERAEEPVITPSPFRSGTERTLTHRTPPSGVTSRNSEMHGADCRVADAPLLLHPRQVGAVDRRRHPSPNASGAGGR